MRFEHSTLVNRKEYSTDGLCHNSLDLRVHTRPDLEEVGIIRAQQDWRTYVGPVENYRGGLGPKFNFIALAVPECLPERLEIISYRMSLHSYITDSVSKEEGDALNDQMLAGFLEGAKNGSISDSFESGKRFLQAQMLREMIAIDRPRALVTMESWASFVELASGRQHFDNFSTLDEYIPYRILDAGKMFWFGIVTFGMGITIPNQELELCHELSRSAYIILGLQNDLFSWEKEVEASIKNKQTHVVNALWVLMREHNISIERAKDLCREKIHEYEADYICTLRFVEQSNELSDDLKKYVEALQFASTANTVWSMTCPRYHKSVDFNSRQKLMMEKQVGLGLSEALGGSNITKAHALRPFAGAT